MDGDLIHFVELILVFVVIRQGGMDLCHGQIGVLKMHFLSTPAVGQLVENNFLYLGIGAHDPGNTRCIDFDLSCESGGHDVFSLA